jgi:pimeloyl-ACP methyl ester carboxylesterase
MTAASLLLVVGLATGQAAEAKADKVKFDTVDGVTLIGKFYPGSKGKKGSTFLFLHSFEKGKGGSSVQDGWADLAGALQAEGHSVLTFDFRGHGESTGVSQDFWNTLPENPATGQVGNPHNKMLGVPKANTGTIDASRFPAKYFFYLVNDISAAKAFLDSKNDSGELNSSDLYVVGAGEGATIGALWMAQEFSRKRVELVSSGPMIRPGGNPFRPKVVTSTGIKKIYEPEGKDIVAGIWLNLSPRVAGQTVPMQQWLKEITLRRGKDRVQMAFLHGEKDDAAKKEAKNFLAMVRPGFDPDKPKPMAKGKETAKPAVGDQEFTNILAIKDSNLAGSKLLRKELPTIGFIQNYVKGYNTQHVAQDSEKRDMRSWAVVWNKGQGQPIIPAKFEGEQYSRVIPLGLWGLSIQ